MTALHLAAQGGHLEAVRAFLEGGAAPRIRDGLHDGPAWGWAEHGGNHEVAELLPS